MTGSIRRRGVAASALALASGTMLASIGFAGPAMADTAQATPAGFMSGATAGDVIQVALNLPQAIPGLNTNKLALGLISAKGTALHDTINGAKDSATAFAGLASGTLVEGPNAPLAALDRSVTATLTNKSAKDALGALPANPLISGTLGGLTALVNSAVNNLSTANLAHADIAKLSDILPASVLDPLNQVADQVVPQAQNVIDQVIQNLQPVLGPVVQNDPTGTAAGVESALENLKSELSGLVQNIESTSLVSLDTLDANQAIDQVNRGVQSQAHVKLVGLNVLGGLVHVDGFVSDAKAFADGVAGDGAADVNPTIAHATIGKSILDVALDPNGLGLSIGGLPSSVVQQVNQGLQQVQAALNNVLANIGLTVTPTEGTTSVSPDGKSAKATGGALTITLAPPTSAGTSLNSAAAAPASAPLLQVRLGGTTAEANAAQAPVVQVRPAALPHTGANLPLTAGVGALLLGAAAMVRRRITS
jgi:LPXTG-motif cell wall-anchored protein